MKSASGVKQLKQLQQHSSKVCMELQVYNMLSGTVEDSIAIS